MYQRKYFYKLVKNFLILKGTVRSTRLSNLRSGLGGSQTAIHKAGARNFEKNFLLSNFAVKFHSTFNHPPIAPKTTCHPPSRQQLHNFWTRNLRGPGSIGFNSLASRLTQLPHTTGYVDRRGQSGFEQHFDRRLFRLVLNPFKH